MSNSTPVPKDVKKKKPSALPPPPPPPHEEPQAKRPQTPPDSPKSSAASHVVKNLIAPPMTPPPNQKRQRATLTTPPPAPRPSRKRAVSEVSDLCPRQAAIRNVRRRLFVYGADDDKGQGGVVGKVLPVHVVAHGGHTPLTGPDQQRRCFVDDVHRAIRGHLEESVP